MAFVTDSNRPQPLWQPPPTACLTASGAASEVPSLLMQPFPPLQPRASSAASLSRPAHQPPNVPPISQGKSLIFNGHVDVVPTGPVDLWTHAPFDPVVEGGWLYGRGCGDMKAGVVAMVYAFKALQHMGLQPASEVQFHSVIDEECTGNGALAALGRGYRADACVIPEPFPFVMTAQLGVLWLHIECTGRPGHVLDTSKGVNAIEVPLPFQSGDRLRGGGSRGLGMGFAEGWACDAPPPPPPSAELKMNAVWILDVLVPRPAADGETETVGQHSGFGGSSGLKTRTQWREAGGRRQQTNTKALCPPPPPR